MKYNDTIDLLKTFVNALIDPTSITNNLRKNTTLKYPRNIELNNSVNNRINDNIYTQPESNNEEYNKSVPMDDNGYYDDNNIIKNDDYYDKKLDTSSNPQGVIDSIAQELTSVRLQQAIILSEIVGKPRSKTRRKRRRF